MTSWPAATPCGASAAACTRMVFLSPTGKPVWSIACISGMLENTTYKGRALYNRHQVCRRRLVGRACSPDFDRPRSGSRSRCLRSLARISLKRPNGSPVITRTSAHGALGLTTGSCGGWWSAGIVASKRIARAAARAEGETALLRVQPAAITRSGWT